MDIDLLSKMVKELILDNDMVVLPGLGAFVAEMVPSTFTDKGYTINPPYRRLYFRSKPDEGTALADFYAESNDVTADVADRVIRDFITELKAILLIRKAVVFPGLGRLRATKENAVFFVADENLDIYPEGFGLASVSLKTHQETQEEVRAAVSELKAMVEDIPQNPEQTVDEPVKPLPCPEFVQAETMIPETSAIEPVAESIPVVEMPEPVAEEVVQKQNSVGEAPVAGSVQWKTILKVLAWSLIGIIAFLALYIVFARMFPQALDHILYTPEELDILNTKF